MSKPVDPHPYETAQAQLTASLKKQAIVGEAMIGRAVLALRARGEPVTDASIIQALEDEKAGNHPFNAPLAEAALKVMTDPHAAKTSMRARSE